MGIVSRRAAEKTEFSKFRNGSDIQINGLAPKTQNGRKWSQNGRQELRIEPRASPGLKTLFAADPGVRLGRRWRDSANLGVAPLSKAVEAAEAGK